jgi:hypothetical protein
VPETVKSVTSPPLTLSTWAAGGATKEVEANDLRWERALAARHLRGGRYLIYRPSLNSPGTRPSGLLDPIPAARISRPSQSGSLPSCASHPVSASAAGSACFTAHRPYSPSSVTVTTLGPCRDLSGAPVGARRAPADAPPWDRGHERRLLRHHPV